MGVMTFETVANQDGTIHGIMSDVAGTGVALAFFNKLGLECLLETCCQCFQA